MCRIPPLTNAPPPFNVSLSLLGVVAFDRVSVIQRDGAGGEAQAALVVAGLVVAGVDPDAPGAVDAVGACEPAGAIEAQVVVLIDGPGGELPVARLALVAGDVTKLALACKEVRKLVIK